MSERRTCNVQLGSGALGGQGGATSRPRLTAHRRLTPAVTQNTTSATTNAPPPSSSSTPPNPASPISNFQRNGRHWSYNYESGGTRVSVNGTGDIPDPITRTTERGAEQITLSRDGVLSMAIIAPPGASAGSGMTIIGAHSGTTRFRITGISGSGSLPCFSSWSSSLVVTDNAHNVIVHSVGYERNIKSFSFVTFDDADENNSAADSNEDEENLPEDASSSTSEEILKDLSEDSN